MPHEAPLEDLFADQNPLAGKTVRMGEQAVLLRGFALEQLTPLWAALQDILRQAPPRHMQTAGGRRLNVPMTNCGALGWTSNKTSGYRYTALDPLADQPWPELPDVFLELADAAAQAAGFARFRPDTCLINRYSPGMRLGLHQDRNERDFSQPIVSVSLGLAARFLWGGMRRNDTVQSLPLFHGDVAVWGGKDRLRYHGVAPVAAAQHPLTGNLRINLSFRKAG